MKPQKYTLTKVDNDRIKINFIVQKKNNNEYYACILHFIDIGIWTFNTSKEFKIGVEFTDTTEGAVIEKCKKWTLKRYPGEYELKLIG